MSVILLSPSTSDPNPLKRLGLVEPQLDKLKVVACTFSAYDALKFRAAPMFSSSGAHMHPNTHISFLESFAEAFRKEALQLAIPTRRFDSTSFLDFLNGAPTTEVIVT